ncbi:ABC transporter ATP-binding protein [Chelatococcus asaccharovorans]|uniref:Peptide/nickel transport system ATP-binding protein n=1 Tax=Chelatococcus asaccharovorans TaxID=28210 RepID=A0A2V3TZK4_9HYPH|nr:ABC transporter ATP-binding protein [Chelatococcus asaccharovorans]MBS7707571.1 ABC transporter ATP-binding protein [Chelatococcus asaccharovorans]PXW55144.1 peptide/nickel transport system ATP-binding protein [Chelatococcus asaccharovorans]CAH1658909.1 putative peptide ABC transporter ATP-binding protein y4tR [Chelatococcus asaccharovorans]CAH1688301.1 putative peptide ABC transporter ATP-binding protein y4tR [Chelatococcus asaccharovorans]
MQQKTSHSPEDAVLSVEDLTTEFATSHGTLRAVDAVSLQVRRGEILGIVGESGSGKSVTGYSIMGLIDRPGAITGGRIMLNGVDLRQIGEEGLRQVRGHRIAMVFQDPMSSLHPMLTIGAQMVDAALAHRPIGRRQARMEARDVLARVGIPSPEERMRSYPHELSGGMRQRVSIAIALLNRPEVIIADEPTTGLDVTIQAQILYEVQKLVAETGTAVIWITHDLSIVAGLADRAAVMYAGRIVEQGTIADVIERPAHPYTAGLLASVPHRNRDMRKLPQIPGSIGNAHSIPGCRFAPRCGFVKPACEARPAFDEVAPGHRAACIVAGRFAQQLAEAAHG